MLNREHPMVARLRCPNVACRHEWNYRGQSKFYASCGYCRTNVHVVRDRIKENSVVEQSSLQESNLVARLPTTNDVAERGGTN